MRNLQQWMKIRKSVMARVLPPRVSQVLSECKNIPTLPPGSYYIFGGTNTGKTILAANLLMCAQETAYMANSNINTIFINTYELLNQIKSTFSNECEYTEHELIDMYKNCDVLVLDDFGLVKPTEWVYQVLYLIMNYRYDYMKTTIYTSNNSLPQVAEIFEDDRLVSRIQRQCKVIEKKPYNN